MNLNKTFNVHLMKKCESLVESLNFAQKIFAKKGQNIYEIFILVSISNRILNNFIRILGNKFKKVPKTKEKYDEH